MFVWMYEVWGVEISLQVGTIEPLEKAPSDDASKTFLVL